MHRRQSYSLSDASLFVECTFKVHFFFGSGVTQNNKRGQLVIMEDCAYIRAFHTHSDLLGDLVKLSLYPTDQKSNIAAKSTASDGGSKSAQLAHLPDWKEASQADSEPPLCIWPKKNFIDLFNTKIIQESCPGCSTVTV